MGRQRRIEIATTGIDEAFQLIGADPYRGISNVGLRVPTLPTTDPDKRYLFNLASFNIADGAKARIIGWRELWTLGFDQVGVETGTHRFGEQVVRDPMFHLQDGNVSWHLRIIGPGEVPIPNLGPIDPPARDLIFRMGDNPGLLFEKVVLASPFYVNLSAYTPPNKGRPWGTPLQNDMATMIDTRTQWRTHGAWHHSLDVPVDGPATVAFFASVRQSNPATRIPLVVPSPFFPNGLSEEEQFLLNFPGAIIWRVAGALVVELDA